MGKKLGGIALFLAGVFLVYTFWHDQGEGPFVRPVGMLAAAGEFSFTWKG